MPWFEGPKVGEREFAPTCRNYLDLGHSQLRLIGAWTRLPRLRHN
jgi:hypothetical protein